MYYAIQKLIIGAFLALFSVQLLAKPLKRDKAVECAAVSLFASSYFKEIEDGEELRKAAQLSFYHFISQASALDTSNNPKEAAQKAANDANKIVTRLTDLAFMEKANLCMDMSLQHAEGIKSAWKE